MKMDYPANSTRFDRLLVDKINTYEDKLDTVVLWKWNFEEIVSASGIFAATRRQVNNIPYIWHELGGCKFKFSSNQINSYYSEGTYIREIQYSEAHVQWFREYVGRVGIDLLCGNSLH